MSGEQDFSELVNGYCSGSLSDEEFALLEDELRRNPELRRDLLELRMLEADLRQFALSLEQQAPETARPMRFLGVPTAIWAAAAAVILLFVAQRTMFSDKDAPETVDVVIPDTEEVSLDLGVAVLAREYGARWAGSSLRPGDSMPPGEWNLESGTAEIQFYSGASVTLQAPARLQIVSKDGGILHSGILRADVPRHAHGFSIKTDAVELVDLGTSFGMNVGGENGTEIHVFDGEVELFEPGSSAQAGSGRLLTAGQGRRFGKSGEEASLEVKAAMFDGAAQLDEQAREEFAQWQKQSADWDRDPALLARFYFEKFDDASREVRAVSSILDPNIIEGVIIGAGWGEGRWPQKGALDFKRPSDRVRVEVPGSYKTITMIASVRIDGLDNYYNSILLSDGWNRQGAFHWQVLRNKSIELSVSGGAVTADDLHSRASFALQPSDLGRWMQFAVVYDAQRGMITHYQDGLKIGETAGATLVPVEIGFAEIGNWTPSADQAREIRNFNGRIDELLIYNSALSAADISQHFTGTALSADQLRASDRITRIDAPTAVVAGTTVSVPVAYELGEKRQIELSLTLDTPPWTNFGSARVTLPAGSGKVVIDVPIDPSLPLGMKAYKFEASVIPIGGDFGDRIDSLPKGGIDCVEDER